MTEETTDCQGRWRLATTIGPWRLSTHALADGGPEDKVVYETSIKDASLPSHEGYRHVVTFIGTRRLAARYHTRFVRLLVLVWPEEEQATLVVADGAKAVPLQLEFGAKRYRGRFLVMGLFLQNGPLKQLDVRLVSTGRVTIDALRHPVPEKRKKK